MPAPAPFRTTLPTPRASPLASFPSRGGGGVFTIISLRFSSAAICLFSSPAVTIDHHLPLSRAQRVDACADLAQAFSSVSLCAIQCKRFSNSLQQFFFLKRLGEKLDCARLHDFTNHGNIAVRGHEDDGKIDAGRAHLLLECNAAHPRQPRIQQQAARASPLQVSSECFCRCDRIAAGMPDRFQAGSRALRRWKGRHRQ